jgi:hypothetical protein
LGWIAVIGCGEDKKDYFVVQYDAAVEAEASIPVDSGGPEVDPTLGGPCTEDAQCDDLIACTFDRCDLTLSRCRNTPDDALCADSEYCNGVEKCVLRRGCVPGAVVTCQDESACTIDRCIEATKSCEHLPRDVDGDGDPDDHCAAHKDCDDNDPTVSSTRAEIRGNGKDDNCNGTVYEQPCSTPANDVCESALEITAPGTFLLDSTAAKRDYPTTCSVSNNAASRDIVVAIKVPDGPAKDVVVRAETSAPRNEVAVALQATCGQASSQIGCQTIPSSSDARSIARSVPGGTTVYAVIVTQTESAVDVKVDMMGASTKPANESCTAPKAVAVDAPFTVSLIDPKKDLVSECDDAKTGELTYSFTLTGKHDVRIFASTLSGNGEAVVSMRAPGCTNELRCRTSSTPPVFARSLAAGTHVFSVAGTGQIDASIVVKTYDPTDPPENQTCATAPAIEVNESFLVDLSGQEDAIKDGCLPGGVNAAYKLDLAEESDVLVIGRFSQGEEGAVSLSKPGCTIDDLLECSNGDTPQRVSRRRISGSHRIVIADERGLKPQLTALVRPSVAPTSVNSDGCVDTQVLPETGGYFVGDTTNATADFGASCDASGQPIGGAKDHLLKLVLTERRRMVFDMTGSDHPTVLDIRKGEACPGIEVPDACNPGTAPNRSFLDFTLDPGTYWVQVDGYAGATGVYGLDVRALPP